MKRKPTVTLENGGFPLRSYPPYLTIITLKNQIVMVGITKFWVATLQMYKVSGFFGFKVYPVNLSESELTELKNFQNSFSVFIRFVP